MESCISYLRIHRSPKAALKTTQQDEWTSAEPIIRPGQQRKTVEKKPHKSALKSR